MKAIHTILAASLLALASTTAVHATSVTSSYASGTCQPALDGTHLRAQPAVIRNDNELTTYVTCGLQSTTATDALEVYLRNQGKVATTATCTMVVSNPTISIAPLYYTLSVNVAAGARGRLLFESDTLYSQYPWSGNIGLSCALTPGLGIEIVKQYNH